MNSLISVIVPVYNAAKYLPECLRSICGQTYTDLEILLIDDGSTDGSGQICDSFAHQDNRVRVIHKCNGGVASSRNAGLRAVTGSYIMFVDSDDTIDREMISVLYQRMCCDGSDMAICKHADVYADGRTTDEFCKWFENVVVSPEWIMEQIADGKRYSPALWGKLYKRDVLNDLTVPDLLCGEDMWLIPDIFSRCDLVSFVDRTLYYYYHRQGSITRAASDAVLLDSLRGHMRMVQHLLNRGFCKSAGAWFSYSLSAAIRLQDKKNGMQLIKQQLDRKQIHCLLKSQNMKTRLKWLSLYLPIISALALRLKNK